MNHTQAGKIRFFKSIADGLYYVRLIGANGEPLAVSEGLTTIENVLVNINATSKVFAGPIIDADTLPQMMEPSN